MNEKKMSDHLVCSVAEARKCFCGSDTFKLYLDEGCLLVIVCNGCRCTRTVLKGTYKGGTNGHNLSVPLAPKAKPGPTRDDHIEAARKRRGFGK